MYMRGKSIEEVKLHCRRNSIPIVSEESKNIVDNYLFHSKFSIEHILDSVSPRYSEGHEGIIYNKVINTLDSLGLFEQECILEIDGELISNANKERYLKSLMLLIGYKVTKGNLSNKDRIVNYILEL